MWVYAGRSAVLLQVQTYKLDFEDERKDREAAHGKIADVLTTKQQLEKEMKATVTSLEKLQDDVVKSKREADTLREELKAKVSQVRQYKKENDRLKGQVHVHVQCHVYVQYFCHL